MKQQIKDLIEISRFYGMQKDHVIAGGGNTSFKDENHLWIKASGFKLGSIDETGFCKLDRQKLNAINNQKFSTDPVLREEEVKNYLLNCRTNPAAGLRPSVETSLHNLFNYRFVVHTHYTLGNGLLCSNQAEEKIVRIFGEEVLYVPYYDPGFILYKAIEEKMDEYIRKFNHGTKVVFIRNHGIFVAADTIGEIKEIYADIESGLKESVNSLYGVEELEVSQKFTRLLPAVRMMLSENNLKIATAFNSSVISEFITDRETFNKNISQPFNPDQVVYCLPEYLFIGENSNHEELLENTRESINEYRQRRGMMPKVIFFQKLGAVVADNSADSVALLKDMVNDFCHISKLSQNFGGPHPLTPNQISFIDSWEVEKFRKQISAAGSVAGRLANKIIIITGAAQGFGAGIARILLSEGANVVVADMNIEKGEEFTRELNGLCSESKAYFIGVNVADPASVESMIQQTVLHFGGLDVMISNAGILHAGSLDEMEPATFELMTKVNYTGYFLCAKYAQSVMKIQHRFKHGYFMDIIQINSKSGLKGSNKNFAYAGGKFGGIGLTQSFALELMPHNIKVNSICPGNLFDGPLWSHPEKGLFVQYLKAGKVPGASTIEEVKAFYESQVPAGRGCTSEDVAKAIFYVIEQHYETGQAVPVTGGQNMLR